MSRAIVLTERVIAKLAKQPGLTQAPALLLWSLVHRLPVAGQILNLTDLATELNLSAATVMNGIKALNTAGFIQRGPRVGRLYIYKLNPAYFYHI